MTNSFTTNLLNITPRLYLAILSVISVYSLHKIFMIWRFYQNRRIVSQPRQIYAEGELPKVTVQLPIYNEMYVVERLLDAVSQLIYPLDKLEIQVLDDSSDETQITCQNKVALLQQQAININYNHRHHRQGFKAGALESGLKSASGELVVIFDADFIPAPDTLLKMVHYFSDPRLAMVQARWVHINRNYSLLTKIQALMLDGHFIIEQMARDRSGCFFNFNGTAGIWRVRAIKDAGGWQHTTVTEDLDLSYRVQLKGWKCTYLPDVVVPAELPMEMNSFKSQQFRWAKGASQVAKKLLIPVFKSSAPLYVKFEAFFHLTSNINYCLLLILLILSLPYQVYISEYQWQKGLLIYLPVFLVTTVNLICFYLVSQREQMVRQPLWQFVSNIFLLMSVGIGISLNQSLAVCEGFLRFGTDFIRTPKHGITNSGESWKTKKYRGAKTWVLSLELLMLLYLLITITFAAQHQHYFSLPFLAMFAIGYIYVLGLSMCQRR